MKEKGMTFVRGKDEEDRTVRQVDFIFNEAVDQS
jgi:hypothetical protein